MELVNYLIDLFLHLDKHLTEIIQMYGGLTYAILFMVIFAETGFVFTPFLPGDSLLFAAGALASLGSLNVHLIFILLFIAAVLGDTLNYWIGHFIGPKIFEKEKIRFLKKEHLDKTHEFFEKYGGKTIIIARFVPIVRTFAPFVAGIGSMTYGKFFAYNIIGGFLWTASLIYSGYFFGNIPLIRNNFSIVVIVIVLISILPGIFEYLRHKLQARKSGK